MKIKKGDRVIVIAGADKGKIGTVQKAFPRLGKVVVDGVHLVVKHQKPTQKNPDGGRIELYAPIDVSNVAIYDEKKKKASRVGYTFENGKKIRISKVSGTKLD